jgi:hypothetical protein
VTWQSLLPLLAPASGAIEKLSVAEQFFEDQIGLKQFSVGPNDRNSPVHAHERLERHSAARSDR